MARLAFYTFGIMVHPTQMTKAFSALTDEIPNVFDDAVNAPGYLEPVLSADKVMPRFYNPDKHFRALVILSIWQDIQSVYTFSYQGRHAQALRSRHAWFLKGEWPGYVAWWIADTEKPTFDEGAQRLEYLFDHGSTPYAFNFQNAFTSSGQPFKEL